VYGRSYIGLGSHDVGKSPCRSAKRMAMEGG